MGRDSARVLAVAAVLVGCGFGLVALAETFWMYALTVVIRTLGEMLRSPSNAATVAALSPPGLRGRYQGLNSLTWSVGTALAPILGGLVLQRGGGTVLWVGCLVLCVLVAVAQLAAGPARARRAALLRTREETGTPAAV